MRSMVEGDRHKGHPAWTPPSVSAFALPPPRAGEDHPPPFVTLGKDSS